MSLTDRNVLKDTPELGIKIRADPEKGILHVMDTGIGVWGICGVW